MKGGHCPPFGTAWFMGTDATMIGRSRRRRPDVPGASSIRRTIRAIRYCAPAAGRRIVEMCGRVAPQTHPTARPSTRLKVHMARGGSKTNRHIHVIAMARRGRNCASNAAFRRFRARSGARQCPALGEEILRGFFYAGGCARDASKLKDRLDLSSTTVTGKTLAKYIPAWKH